MKEYEVKMVFDLTKPEENNLYNSIRSLDGIKNAIVEFRKELNRIKADYEAQGNSECIPPVLLIENQFVAAFKEQGINI